MAREAGKKGLWRWRTVGSRQPVGKDDDLFTVCTPWPHAGNQSADMVGGNLANRHSGPITPIICAPGSRFRWNIVERSGRSHPRSGATQTVEPGEDGVSHCGSLTAGVFRPGGSWVVGAHGRRARGAQPGLSPAGDNVEGTSASN